MSYIFDLADQLWLLLPIGIVGLWRWTIWLIRRVIGLRYRPQAPEMLTGVTVSLVTPVYNEDPELFRNALESWTREEPDEIIAVIDVSDKACIRAFGEFIENNDRARMIITNKPGKRAALADGIEAANGEVVVLIDSDTIWDRGVLALLVTPFRDPKVGGVGTRQNVLKPKTVAQRLFDIHLDSRYLEEIRFLAAAGDALTCLSGRTAAYRRSAVLPLLDDLLNETFWGKPCISGDDKRLTHLVQAHGWRVRYQENARVYTPGAAGMRSFLKQRLRWTRNSWRADLRAMVDGWVWKKPALAFHLVDRVFQPFATLIAPIYFALSLFYQQWTIVGILLVWWFISRAIKIFPHLKRRPSGIMMLPVYIFATFLLALFKVYALFTMNEQGWITRWDKSRLRPSRRLRMVPAYGATLSVVFLVGFGMVQLHDFYGDLVNRQTFEVETELPGYDLIAVSNQIRISALPGENEVGAQDVATGFVGYQVRRNDTRARLTRQYGLHADAIVAPPGELQLGQKIQIEMPFDNATEFRRRFSQMVTDTTQFDYLANLNTVIVSGEDTVIDLPTLYQMLNNDNLLEYEGEGVYILKTNLLLEDHTMLLVEGPAVTWLKLKSDAEGFVTLLSLGGSVFIGDTRITSWDPSAGEYDTNYKDGRSYILVKNARMDIVNSEVSHLGYALDRDVGQGGVYGLSWRIDDETKFGTQLTTGYVSNNRFHHNYFGLYTFGATGMVFRNNEIYENIEYGLDPHDDSNNFIVERNYVHDNGNHGIIFSKRCFNNVIRWNRSENNRLHGVMLDRQSNDNSVYENILIGNTDGVAIWDSHNNAIYDNTVHNNKRGIRMNNQASHNLATGNEIVGSLQYGVYLYDQAQQNWIFRNQVLKSQQAGVYIRSSENYVYENLVQDGKYGVYLNTEASRNQIQANQILSHTTAIYLKTGPDDLIQANQFEYNQNNILISTYWVNSEDNRQEQEEKATLMESLIAN